MPSTTHPSSPAVTRALQDAIARYRERNPQSAKLQEAAQSRMPGGNTRTTLFFEPFPLYMASSEGARLRDVDGHEYSDFLGEYTAGLYGHRDSRIQAAVVAAAERGSANGAPGATEGRLAELICHRFENIERIRFCNSGTEANLYALSLARIATGRKKFITFRGGYHGGVFLFKDGGNPMNVPFDFTVLRYNDPEAATQAIAALSNELAAVIVEPMMAAGGAIPATKEFLQTLREETQKTGALLVLDEIVTSRMSSGGLQKIHDVRPDLTTLGKYFGAGFSFGAFGGRSDLLDRFDPRRPDALMHSGTFNNNVFTMSAGVVGLEQIFTPERAEILFHDGERLRSKLDAIVRRLPWAKFTGCGSVMNLHFAEGEITRPEDFAAEPRELMQLFHFDMLESGIYLAGRGQIALSLPMNVDDFDRVERAVKNFVQKREALIVEFFRS
ncbi:MULTISPECIES: aminotransferase class III-fold pyridoxal phosphate-dependent enzyme [unclassified Variovorax]|uniref:aspartate aminotransferase family protein n=1 Tax=unclassified Variovorax TaxID=663243 RepID=UPI00076DE954|nr:MULTISPECIES: aminotransferase class III-fold pyridoxal phosphate-dependent enzyme [unclassified Variovorax]KWT75303.1 Glutamate-1-semialdehyde aminotransferase [Variovorax sp. WDL1]PNG51784.1 Beta-phenylalanine transaminase [Variovorax sp. B2]PNG54131.1 Beta-phenylalanine transaminase [Variovorax sp. B4]VTV11609.1 Beta-phenylalanine transaminase [Variovorax sp. WDL1]